MHLKRHWFEFHLRYNTLSRAFVQQTPQCVSEERTFLLFTPECSLNREQRRTDPMTLSEAKKWSETHQQRFILHVSWNGGNEESPGSDLGEIGTDKTLQLVLKPRRHRINGSAGDNPGLTGQRTKPEAVLTWRANFAGPLGQIVPLNNVRVTTTANVSNSSSEM